MDRTTLETDVEPRRGDDSSRAVRGRELICAPRSVSSRAAGRRSRQWQRHGIRDEKEIDTIAMGEHHELRLMAFGNAQSVPQEDRGVSPRSQVAAAPVVDGHLIFTR